MPGVLVLGVLVSGVLVSGVWASGVWVPGGMSLTGMGFVDLGLWGLCPRGMGCRNVSQAGCLRGIGLWGMGLYVSLGYGSEEPKITPSPNSGFYQYRGMVYPMIYENPKKNMKSQRIQGKSENPSKLKIPNPVHRFFKVTYD